MIGFNPCSCNSLYPQYWQSPMLPWSWTPPPMWTAPVSQWDFPSYFNPYPEPPRELPPLDFGPTSGNVPRPGRGQVQLDQLRNQQRLFANIVSPSQFNASTQTLLDNFATFDTAAGLGGGQDGIIGRPDLEAVANDELADPKLRQAANFMLRNQALHRAVDSANGTGYDDRFNREELQKSLETFANQHDVSPLDVNNGWDDKRVSSVLSKWVRVLDGAAGGEVDGKFGRADLQAIWDSPDASLELRVAAQKMLGSPTLFNRLDSGNGAMDGVFSDGDLQRVLNP